MSLIRGVQELAIRGRTGCWQWMFMGLCPGDRTGEAKRIIHPAPLETDVLVVQVMFVWADQGRVWSGI